MREASKAMLESLGLSETEERVYDLLVDRPNETLDALSESAGLSKVRVRTAIESLESRALVSRSAGRPLRFVLAPPQVALEALILKRQEHLAAARLTAERLEARYRKALQSQGTTELVEVLDGPDAVAQRSVQLERAATTEILSLYKPPYAASPESIGTELDLLARGVHHRFIYDREALDDPVVMHSVLKCVAAGERARSMSRLPMKLAIFDRRVALLPIIQNPGTVDKALHVHPSSLLDGLLLLFESYWEQALPVVPDRVHAPEEEAFHSDQDDILIAGLLSGLKSHAIARQLDVAVSTVERRIQRLMKSLGVETRFQAGYQLAMRVHDRENPRSMQES